MSPTRPPADAPAADLHRLSASVDRLTAHVADWSTRRLLDEGLDLVRDAAWADACALFRVGDDEVAVLHTRPTLRPDGSALDEGDVPRPPVSAVVPTDWFPWGLAPIQADRFVLDGATLGSLGVRSCLHLPLRQRGRTVGAIQVFWSEPRLVWDDDRGRLLRTLGRFLLTCDGRQRR
jgi:GAF domain-containing protein